MQPTGMQTRCSTVHTWLVCSKKQPLCALWVCSYPPRLPWRQDSLLDIVCKDRSNFPFSSLKWPPKAGVVGVVKMPISDQQDLGRSWVFAVLLQPSGLQSWGKKELSCSLCPKPHKATLCSSVTQRILLLGNCFLIYAFHIIPVTLTFGIKTQDGVNKPFS